MAMARPAAPPASLDAVATAAVGRCGWPVVVCVWAAFALWQAASQFSGALSAMSTDDAMRLAEVRDLMAGQGWFDLTQRRLDPPVGVLMHWSRLIDLPVAALLGLFERLFDADAALKLTLTLWPWALLLAAMLACASAAAGIAGPSAGALSAILFVASPAVTAHFDVGAIDHHGAQIALTLAMLACALRLERAAAAIGAGLTAAATIAIGLETAPLVAACAAAIALRWAAVGEPVARGARSFGLAFAGAMVALAAATLPPDAWLAPVCDAMGVGHLAVAVVGGVGLAAAAAFTTGGRLARLAALAQVAFAALAGLAIVAPNCLASPYAALPERLKTDWLAHVREAHGFLSFAGDKPAAALAIGFALSVVAAACAWAAWSARGEARPRAWTVAAVFTVTCAMTLWQVRCASLAFAVGGALLPATALAIARSGGKVRLCLATAGLSPALLALAGLGLAQAAGLRTIGIEPAAGRLCPVADYRALVASAPAGRALNTIDSGPFLLAHTPLEAIAGPYHRNIAGITAALDAFGGSPEAARAVAVSRGADLVVFCPTDGGAIRAAKTDPDGFAAALLSGRAPDWLAPIDLGPQAKLRAWRVATGR